MGVGLRLRNPDTPAGFRMEVLIMIETLPKMRQLLEIVGGRTVEEKLYSGFVKMVIEKKQRREPR